MRLCKSYYPTEIHSLNWQSTTCPDIPTHLSFVQVIEFCKLKPLLIETPQLLAFWTYLAKIGCRFGISDQAVVLAKPPSCKGTYASVRPYRHTYGNYGIRLQTWTQVIVNRCIRKIIARDLSLMASRLYRMAVTRPQSCVAVTLSPSSGADLLGCIIRTREKESKGKKALYIPAAYVLVWNHMSRHRLVHLIGDLSADPVDGDTPYPLTGGENPCRCHLYRAEIQRREEEKRETRIQLKVIPSPYLDFLTEAMLQWPSFP